MKKRGSEWRKNLSLAKTGIKATPEQLEGLKTGRRFGRTGLKGERNPRSKITVEIVKEIRSLYATGEYSQQKIADKFEITQNMVSKIVLRQFWKDVK